MTVGGSVLVAVSWVGLVALLCGLSRWRNSSAVTRVVGGAAQDLGRVNAGRQSDGRLLVCFTPAATGARGCPSVHRVLPANMALNRWYYTSAFTVTVPSPTHPSAAAREAAQRTASGGGEPMGAG